MNIFKRIFSGPDAVAESIKTVKAGVDALYFSQEEKAAMHQKLVALFVEFQRATSGQNLARRLIALQFTTVWTLLALVCAFMLFTDHAKSGEMLHFLMTVVNPPVLLILGFYYWTHKVRAQQ